ncbi:Fez family zinc finger protein 2 [Rhypophila decipiens]
MFNGVGYGDECLGLASGSNQQSAPIADPMDLDIDLDLEGLGWANDINPFLPSAPELNVPYDNLSQQTPNFQSGAGYPVDLLFLEDEGTLPVFYDVGFQQQVPPMARSVPVPSPAPHGIDIGLEQLRHQLALLAGGSCGDELVFKDCEPSKAIAVHNLALEFGLNYTHDAKSCAVSLSRNRPETLPSTTQHHAMTSTAQFQSETGHETKPSVPNTSLCHSSADTDDFDLLYEKFIQEPLTTKGLTDIPRYQLTETYLPATTAPRTSAPAENETDSAHKKAKDKETVDRQPSRSERIGRSISKHLSAGWKTTVAKGGRRGPLTLEGRRDMKVLEGAGGACWRCKVLKRKCTPEPTCRCCLQSVATPSVGEDAPLWPIIGCRRGQLGDAVAEQILCPKARNPRRSHDVERCGSFRSQRSMDSVYERCLLGAESQRFADMKAVLEGASDKISIAEGGIKRDFVSFVELGRYRNQDCLSRRFTYQETSLSYSDLIATIAWELAENETALPLLEIKSWKALMTMLETACIYEAEVGQTELVMISMICLRQCLQALRLISADLLHASAHEDCTAHCEVHYIRELLACVRAYIDELSGVIFNKENMRDRRWWLSTFYSLCIQSYVRHALLAIEKQLCFPDVDDVPPEDLTSTQYLHLAGVLFTAASAKYDPLLGGQYQYALTDNSVIPETSIPELHHASVRAACEVDTWGEAGIKSSYQFLRRLLQIGSLDFDGFEQHDVEMEELEAPGDSHETNENPAPPSISSPTTSSLASPRDSSYSYPVPSFRSARASFDSRYSFPSFTSMSNPSEESLAQTFVTDMTSIYDVPMDLLTKSTSGVPAETNKVSAPLSAVRNPGMTSPTSLSVSSMNGSFVCGCCPKLPRSFPTLADLSQHESEKPHACSHCKMRFKSPKEAERHINAIHLKSDFWSCDVLRNPILAFHCEVLGNSKYDVCGFCGGEFQRAMPSDLDLGGSIAHSGINEFELIQHLDEVHKRGVCNLERRFYRVDNFRQHLKTAHFAKTGRWLKVLERNCRSGGRPP